VYECRKINLYIESSVHMYECATYAHSPSDYVAALHVCALRMNVTSSGPYLQATLSQQQPVDRYSSKCLRKPAGIEVSAPPVPPALQHVRVTVVVRGIVIE